MTLAEILGDEPLRQREFPVAREKIDTACRRVLRLKDRMGLLDDL